MFHKKFIPIKFLVALILTLALVKKKKKNRGTQKIFTELNWDLCNRQAQDSWGEISQLKFPFVFIQKLSDFIHSLWNWITCSEATSE